IRKAQQALRESKHGPRMMRTLKIATIREAARKHLDGLPATDANAEAKVALAAEKMATQIEADLYRPIKFVYNGDINPEEVQRLKEQFKASIAGLSTQVVPAATTEIEAI